MSVAAVTESSKNRSKDVAELQRQHKFDRTKGTDIRRFHDASSLEGTDSRKLLNELQKMIDDSIRMYIVEVQHMDPTGDKSYNEAARDASSTLQMMADVASTKAGFVLQQEKMTAGLQKFLGREVACDDNMRTFEGSEVTFNYELEFAKDQLPEAAMVETKITIFDSSGREVFHTRGANTNGKHNLVWNGKNDKGNEVEPGEYRIQGISYARIGNGAPIDVKFSTEIRGIIDSVRIEGHRGKLMVGDRAIDPKQVTSIALKPDTKNEVIDPKQYLGNIGQNAAYDLSKFEVKNGRGTIRYNNTYGPLQEAKIKLYKDDKYLTSVDVTTLQPGLHTLPLNLTDKKFTDGKYSYVITATPEGSDSKPVTLPKEYKFSITGVSLQEGKLLSDEQKFDLSYVTSIMSEHRSVQENDLYMKSAQYIGKTVSYENPIMVEFRGGANFEYDFMLNNPGDDNIIEAAELRIFDISGQQITSIHKSAGALYTKDSVPVPLYHDLNAASKQLVDDYIAKTFRADAITNYGALVSAEQTTKANDYIEQEFRGGKLFIEGQDTTDAAVRLKNMGIVRMIWDGTLADGKVAPRTEGQYTAKLYNLVRESSGVIDEQEIVKYTVSTVKATEVNNGTIELILSNDHRLNVDDIVQIKG